MKERGLLAPRSCPEFMLGGVYVIYDDGRPLVEAYDGPQIVGMDLHRRRSVRQPELTISVTLQRSTGRTPRRSGRPE